MEFQVKIAFEQFIQIVKVSTIFETECFFNLFLEVSQINKLQQLEFKLEKIIGI